MGSLNRVTLLGNMGAEAKVQQYLPKGAQVYVEGKLRTRKYTKDGVEKYTTEVIAENIILLRGNSRMQPNAGNGSYNAQTMQGGTSYQGTAQNATQSPTEGKKDDDLPF